ncbi:hypothetical protein NDU88_001679, partial [Pleurodeles waltl]
HPTYMSKFGFSPILHQHLKRNYNRADIEFPCMLLMFESCIHMSYCVIVGSTEILVQSLAVQRSCSVRRRPHDPWKEIVCVIGEELIIEELQTIKMHES